MQKLTPEFITKSCVGVKDNYLLILSEDGNQKEEQFIINEERIGKITSLTDADGIWLVKIAQSGDIRAWVDAEADTDETS